LEVVDAIREKKKKEKKVVVKEDVKKIY